MSSEDDNNEFGCGCGCGVVALLLFLICLFPNFFVIIFIAAVIWAVVYFSNNNYCRTKRQRSMGENFSSDGPVNDLDVTMAIMRLVGYVARANDVITQKEISHAEDIIQQLDPAHRTLFINAFNNGKSQMYLPDRDISYLTYVCGQRGNALQTVLSMLVYIALADGTINEKERDRVYKIGTAFGFSIRDIDDLIREMSPHNFGGGYSGSRSNTGGSSYGSNGGYGNYGGSANYGSSDYAEALSLLGATENDTPDDITKKYKRLIRKYHPDLIKAKGLPENMRSVYEQKTKEINEAYDIVKKYRGF